MKGHMLFLRNPLYITLTMSLGFCANDFSCIISGSKNPTLWKFFFRQIWIFDLRDTRKTGISQHTRLKIMKRETILTCTIHSRCFFQTLSKSGVRPLLTKFATNFFLNEPNWIAIFLNAHPFTLSALPGGKLKCNDTSFHNKSFSESGTISSGRSETLFLFQSLYFMGTDSLTRYPNWFTNVVLIWPGASGSPVASLISVMVVHPTIFLLEPRFRLGFVDPDAWKNRKFIKRVASN